MTPVDAGHTLLEREAELDLLAGLLANIDSSGGRVVLIRGEAGIGKTALVREFVRRSSDDAHVLVGWCDDLLTPRPLSPLWDMARSEPPLAESLGSGDRAAVLETLLDLLSRGSRATVLVIEDTQWADEATLDAVKYLGRRIATTNGLLVLTYRDGEVDVDHPLRGVIGDLPPEAVVRIQLWGLSLSAVALMIRDTALTPDEVYGLTDGNPFLVTEMASHDDGLIPSSVQDSVTTRARKLTPQAYETLRTLSVIPDRVPRQQVSQLTGATPAGLIECEERGLLEIRDEFVVFRHELIRRAVEAILTETEREALNRKILEVLPPDTDAARLVHHAHQAGDIEQLVELAPRAAAAAVAVGSHREAVDHYRQLAPHIDRLRNDIRGPILERWAREEAMADNFDEAIRLGELAIRHYRHLGDQTAESRAHADAAFSHEMAGQRARAERSARLAVDVLGPNPDGSDLARALEIKAYLAMMACDFTATLELVDRALQAAGDDIDEWVLIRCLNHKGVIEDLHHYPDGKATVEEAIHRAEAAGLPYEMRRALINRGEVAAENRDLPTAVDYLKRAIAFQERHVSEMGSKYAYAQANLARVLELQGKWTEAEDLIRDLPDRGALTQMVALPVLGAIEARTGRDTARTTLGVAWDMATVADEIQRLVGIASALAEHAWISGHLDQPASDFVGTIETGLDVGYLWSAGSIALWLWKLGDLADAPEGIAEPYRLLIEGDPMAAAQRFEDLGIPYERAIALSHGDHKAQLDALEILETLGAAAVAAKLRKTMRDQGLVVPRGRGRETRHHAAGLTARQAEVLDLLAKGLTNLEIADQLFLSPRTVEHHVSAVMNKLNASTRQEAVTTAAEQGLLVPT